MQSRTRVLKKLKGACKLNYKFRAGITPTRLGNIQFLRAFAALGVIFFHLVGSAHKHGILPVVLDPLGRWGNSGVDIFFVISGFVMVESQRRKPTNAFKFLTRRILRIVPLYWFLTLAYWTLGISAPSLFPNLKLSFPWLVASLSFMSGNFGFPAPILGQGWTLEFEMLFYLIFALTLWTRNSVKSGILTIAIMLSTVMIFHSNAIIIEFCFGVLVGLIYEKFRLSAVGGYFFVVIGMSSFLLTLLFGTGSWNRVIVYGIPAFFLVLGLINVRQTQNKLFIMLGDSSYSAYLFQFFVIPLLFKFAVIIPKTRTLSDIVILLFALITVAAGEVLYQVVERRMTIKLYTAFNVKKTN